MSSIKQVGPNHWVAPEEFGYTPNFHIFQHAADHYPLGNLIQIDPLNPGNKRINFVHDTTKPSEIEELKKFFKSVSAGKDEGFLDMRVRSVIDRDELMGPVVIFILLWLALKGSALIDGLDWSETYILDLIAASLIGITLAFVFFSPLATPVRFNKLKQEVYVWHKKILYRIPWHECELTAIVAKTHLGQGRLSDGYELILWLNPLHAVNVDLTGHQHQYLRLFHESGNHAPVYRYWEYVRRYMADEKLLWIEANRESCLQDESVGNKVATSKTHKVKNIFSALFHFIMLLPILLIFGLPVLFSLWCKPLKQKWPEQVHDWTGKRCNWY